MKSNCKHMMFHLFLLFCFASELSTDLIMDAIFTKDDSIEKEHTSKTDCDETTNANTEVTICEVSRLKQENETLRSNMTCKICLDARVGKLFLPCRHLLTLISNSRTCRE